MNPIVRPPCGPIQGRIKEDTLLFAGIPYAQAPRGDLRFKAPQPIPPFADTLAALRFGPAAPQTVTGGLTGATVARWDEDCLTLNISAPLTAIEPGDRAERAVLVWIHGGGYRTGQGAVPWYNGTRFARDADIVVVTINYRLGALGFADLSSLGEAYATSGFNGTLDQIAALSWVKDNIGAFGGDPDRVTVAGESAGGFSVATLLAANQAQGLFQRAIPQSGAGHHTLPREAALQVTQQFLHELADPRGERLLSVPAEDILAAQQRTIAHFEHEALGANALGVSVSPFYPVHGTSLLPLSPIDAISAGMGSQVAVLTGSNADETTLWGFGEVDDGKLNRMAGSLGAAATLNTYRKTRPDADAQALLIALTSDHLFRIPGIRLAEARFEAQAATWMYLFNWRSRAFGGKLGATHALEIPFVFNNLDRAGVDVFLGPGDSPQHLANEMHQAWCRFIKEGDPGWPAYDPHHRATMSFDHKPRLVNDPAASERLAWEGLR
ncbi:MAG TPA: carboxylesterase [Gammaproteobacteria bacterium]|nr:carboxylesterase [Gammaproteobacteria bacterium]|tara:strand:- start:1561 stop:3048 length:1488 start_codon:yes stop_codon:yes gene_type:complete